MDSTSVSDVEPNGGQSSMSRGRHQQKSRRVRNSRFLRSTLTRNKPNKMAKVSPSHGYSTLLTQLSSFSVGPDGLSQRSGRVCTRPVTVDRYRAIKRAREAALNVQVPSSSSDSDNTVDRPVAQFRRRAGTPSDEELPATLGEVCSNCQYRPKNAIIMHGHVGHTCFCYTCAMKKLRKGEKCATCGHKVRKVVKVTTTRRAT